MTNGRRFILQGTPPASDPPFTASLAIGAVVTFEGRVRDHNDGRRVVRLAYSAYPALAEREAERILDEASQRFQLSAAAAVHRLGELLPGDIAVRVWAAATHRQEAFDGCVYIIDAIKARVPIWKKETYDDGAQVWVACTHASAAKS